MGWWGYVDSGGVGVGWGGRLGEVGRVVGVVCGGRVVWGGVVQLQLLPRDEGGGRSRSKPSNFFLGTKELPVLLYGGSLQTWSQLSVLFVVYYLVRPLS